MNQIELRRQAIADRFAHAWNKSATRIPIPLKEYKALLDLWEACQAYADNPNGIFSIHYDAMEQILKKLEKGG